MTDGIRISGTPGEEMRVLAEARTTRFPSPQHFVRVVVAGAPTMLGALAEQGPAALDALTEEVAAVLGSWVDDEGLAFPQASHIVSARA
jgi:hypothetical protein